MLLEEHDDPKPSLVPLFRPLAFDPGEIWLQWHVKPLWIKIIVLIRNSTVLLSYFKRFYDVLSNVLVVINKNKNRLPKHDLLKHILSTKRISSDLERRLFPKFNFKDIYLFSDFLLRHCYYTMLFYLLQ